MSNTEYMTDPAGRLVPLSLVKDEHKLEDELVRRLMKGAQQLHEAIAAFREQSINDIMAYRDLLAEQYETVLGGQKGNMTLSSYDGVLRITIAIGDSLAFGPELQIAKKLIDECLDKWTKDSNDHVRVIVMDAFDVGKEGKLQPDKILGLRRLNINDSTWLKAMEAISNAVRIHHSKQYIRFHHRSAPNQPYTQLPLDIARV